MDKVGKIIAFFAHKTLDFSYICRNVFEHDFYAQNC